MSSLERHLERLESEKPQRQRMAIWREWNKTTEEAKAARFPDGVPDNTHLAVIGWRESSGEVAKAGLAGLTPQDGSSYGGREP